MWGESMSIRENVRRGLHSPRAASTHLGRRSPRVTTHGDAHAYEFVKEGSIGRFC